MAWVREGECCRCGECCTGDPMREDMQRPGEVEGFCPLYALLPDGEHGCSDRSHSYYLAGCNVWPQHPDNLIGKPSCSYTFRWEG
jgi:hypothetical protein